MAELAEWVNDPGGVVMMLIGCASAIPETVITMNIALNKLVILMATSLQFRKSSGPDLTQIPDVTILSIGERDVNLNLQAGICGVSGRPTDPAACNVGNGSKPFPTEDFAYLPCPRRAGAGGNTWYPGIFDQPSQKDLFSKMIGCESPHMPPT
jgi:hypothetical protein